MKKMFYTTALALITSAAVAEEPIKLNDAQMDSVVAGQQIITDPGTQPVLFPDSFFSGNGPLQVTGVEMVMPGDNVSSVVRGAVDAFLKAKKAF